MKRLFVPAALAAMMWAATVPVLAAESSSGATAQSAPAGKDAADRKAKREEWCKANPERCAQARAKIEERRKECQADPEKCKAERKAKAGEWCKAHPEKCKEMQAKRKQCEANPADCPHRPGAAPAAK